MLVNWKKLKDLKIHATDGDLGSIDQLFFDDESWEVRYIIVDTGGWLGGRPVLISPQSVIQVDWANEKLYLSLTKEQVENSPPIDTQRPVSRQHEIEYLGYYGFPLYWQGSGMLVADEITPLTPAIPTAVAVTPDDLEEQADTHLRSTDEVSGYYIEAEDGELGHVAEFIVDDQAWKIRYIEVATQNWWPGKKVLISPAWVERVSWNTSKVYVALSQRAIQEAPEYDGEDVTREYESQLFAHYGRPNYWVL